LTERGWTSVAAGDVFLIRGQMAHGYAGTENLSLVNVLFEPRRLRLPMADLAGLPGYHALFRVEPGLRNREGFTGRLRLPADDLATAAEIIAEMEDEIERRAPGWKFMACTHLMRLIGFLSRRYSQTDRPESQPLLRMGRVLSYIEEHFNEPIRMRHLTKIAGMSESTLARLFHRVMGRPPMDHVIRVRVARAAELLSSGDLRVTEAAFKCGFNDSNYFSRQFRKVMGVSPREYRLRRSAA